MDRKWRTNRGALDTVLSFPAFKDLLTPWQQSYKLATLTDLYNVYTVLHIEDKQWEIQWSTEGQFYYFIAKQIVPPAGAEQHAAAPEGDEDMPAPRAESELGDQDQRLNSLPNLMAVNAAEYSGDEEIVVGEEVEEEEEEEGNDIEATEREQEDKKAADAAPINGEHVIRTQLIVPVSSAYADLTPELLQRFFSVRGVQVQQMILGLVDSNGVVTRCSMYNYIQAPLEGPGTANLELLDD